MKRTHQPYDYGIIIKITEISFFVNWVGDHTPSGYNHRNYWLSMEIVE